MESFESFIFTVFGVGLLFCGITIFLNLLCMVISVLYLVIRFFFELFSPPKYPNCAKAIGKKDYQMSKSGDQVFFRAFLATEMPQLCKSDKKKGY